MHTTLPIPMISSQSPFRMPKGDHSKGKIATGILSPTVRPQYQPPVITDEYVLFFGYEGFYPEVCLQQWYPTTFYDPDSCNPETGAPLHFRTSEQYMMYWKALLMGDDESAMKIIKSTTPKQAKSLGRQVKDFDQV